jgi:hypothetical protein
VDRNPPHAVVLRQAWSLDTRVTREKLHLTDENEPFSCLIFLVSAKRKTCLALLNRRSPERGRAGVARSELGRILCASS